MVATGSTIVFIHALRNAGPLPLVRQDKVLLIQIETVLYCIIIDAPCEPARLHQLLSGQVVFIRDAFDLARRIVLLPPFPTENIQAQVIRFTVDVRLQ